jgi:hypothetical protein
MNMNVRYGFFILILISSFTSSFCQRQRKIVFPVTIVIFAGIDTIYCFEDSLSEHSKLIPINTEKDYIEFVNNKLESIEDIDTALYKPMIRLNAIFTEKFGESGLPWNRVFKYDGKTKRTIGFWYRDENSEFKNYSILKKIIKNRLNK